MPADGLAEPGPGKPGTGKPGQAESGPGRPGRLFQGAAATHPGRVRTVNEDNFLVSPEGGVFAVADGMGGHDSGALASRTLVEALATMGQAVSASDLLDRLEDRVLRANASLQEIATRNGRTLGTTLAVLLIFEEHFACVWCGDSRIYRVRGGTITQMSRDHTEIQDLMARGILTPAEARTWPRRHVITRAIGVRPKPELELEHGTVEPDDTFLLCSDGLTGHVEDAEILRFLTRARSPQDACDALVDLTLERGASDNVTVVVARAPGRLGGGALLLDTASTVVVARPERRPIHE